MRAPVAAVLLLAALVPTGAIHAQSVDDCMRAAPAEAIPICRALIDTGDADSAVWVQLGLSLNKSGRSDEASHAVAEGIERYPRDADLLALRDRLNASQSEAAQLEQAAERNASAMAKGDLKLVCRTRQGPVAIEACRRYLDMTDVDGDRIRKRLVTLEKASGTLPQPVPEVVTLPAPETPSESDVGGTASLPESTSTVDERPASPPIAETPVAETSVPLPDPEADRRRERVAKIQRALTALGLPTGVADGIAGQRTRNALARFDALTGHTSGTANDEGTLAVLEAERGRLERAEATLAASREAASEARNDEARTLLARARSESALLAVPAGYAESLEETRLSTLAQRREADEKEAARRRTELEARAPNESRIEADVQADADVGDEAPRVDAPSTSVDGDDARTALLVRIGSLERQLDDTDVTAQRETARIRQAVQDLLGRGVSR